MTIRTATPRTESSSGMCVRTSGVSPAACEAERGKGIGEAIAAECAMSAIAYANLEPRMMARTGGMNATVIQGEGLDKSSALNLSGRIPELDGIRGLAILLVILCHYVGSTDHAPL